MFSFLSLLIFPALSAASLSPSPTLTKLSLYDFPSARCLDGSPGAYYIAPPLSDSRKFVFSLQGGGECTGLEDCKDRTKGDLGSSDHLASTMDISGQRFLSQDEDENPFWFDATHVRVMYCSGDLFSGNGAINEDIGVYFSGAKIIDAVVKEVSKDWEGGEVVLWTGESAGGIGAMMSVDRVAQSLSNSTVVAAPVAGFYWPTLSEYHGEGASEIDYPFFPEDWVEMAKTWSSVLPSNKCARAVDVPETCLTAHINTPFVESDIFFVESQTDSVQLSLHNGIGDEPDGSVPTQTDYVLEWTANMTSFIKSHLSTGEGGGRRVGTFNPSCYTHTSFSADKPLIDGRHYAQAFYQWYFNGDTEAMQDTCDEGVFHCNPTC